MQLLTREGAAFGMTECNGRWMLFRAHDRREVVASFNGGMIRSDGGMLLLWEVDRRLNLVQRLSQCFRHERSPLLVQHRVEELIAQRVYALTLGYADLNDHEQLRHEPLLA